MINFFFGSELFNDADSCQGFTTSVIDEWKYSEYWWNVTGGRKWKCSEENLLLCGFFYRKSYMCMSGVEAIPPQRRPGDYRLKPRHHLWFGSFSFCAASFIRVLFRNYLRRADLELYINLWKEKNQQDAAIRSLLLTSVSTCFGHHYTHLQENKGPVTALFCNRRENVDISRDVFFV